MKDCLCDAGTFLPVPVYRPEHSFVQKVLEVVDRLFEPVGLLVMCFILVLGSFVSSMIFAAQSSEVLARMAEISEDVDRRIEIDRELCRQTRAYVESEMERYGVLAGEIEALEDRIDGVAAYTRETRKYVEWER